MAEYPGLPNWGYGLNIPAETLLQLLPGTPQRRELEAAGTYRRQAGAAMESGAANDAERNRLMGEQQQNQNWTELGQLLARMDMMRDLTTGALPVDLQPIYDAVIQRMGMTPQPRGLPGAPGAGGLTTGGLNGAREGAGRGFWDSLIEGQAAKKFASTVTNWMTPSGGQSAKQPGRVQQTPGKSFDRGTAGILPGSPSFTPFMMSDTGPAQPPPQAPFMQRLWDQPIPTLKEGSSNFWNSVYGPGIPADMWTKISQLPLDYLDTVSRVVR